jgi:hypothetical protein
MGVQGQWPAIYGSILILVEYSFFTQDSIIRHLVKTSYEAIVIYFILLRIHRKNNFANTHFKIMRRGFNLKKLTFHFILYICCIICNNNLVLYAVIKKI